MRSWTWESRKFHSTEVVFIPPNGNFKSLVMGELGCISHLYPRACCHYVLTLRTLHPSSPCESPPSHSLLLLRATARGQEIKAYFNKVCTAWVIATFLSVKDQHGFWAPSSEPIPQIALIWSLYEWCLCRYDRNGTSGDQELGNY